MTIAAKREPNKRRWVEPITAIIMALVTLFTAWCSYESAAWTRKSNRLMNDYNALERKAAFLRLQGMQVANIHVALFTEFLAAQQAGNERLAGFYLQRFPPELRKAYDGWIAQKPLENPQADAHPFVTNLYQIAGTQEANDYTATAAAKLEEARGAGGLSGQYLANTVLFATVLFFANALGKFEQRRVRLLSFLFALAVFVFAAIRTLTLPIA